MISSTLAEGPAVDTNIFQIVKSSVSTYNAAERYGIKFLYRGQVWWALCPFHKEDTPSFTVNDKGRWKCWGACGESGDVISFVAKLFNERPIEAARRLANDFGIEIPNANEHRQLNKQPIKHSEPVKKPVEPFDLIRALEEWRNEQYDKTAKAYWILDKYIKNGSQNIENEQDLFWEAVRLKDRLEKDLDALLDSIQSIDPEVTASLYIQAHEAKCDDAYQKYYSSQSFRELMQLSKTDPRLQKLFSPSKEEVQT